MSTALSLDEVLASPHLFGAQELEQFHGFGGLHGGLTAALLARATREEAPAGGRLVSLTSSFLRPAQGPLRIWAEPVASGNSTCVMHAWATSGGHQVAYAEAVISSRAEAGLPKTVSPSMPAVAWSRKSADRFVVPADFVPISTRMEIRPAVPGLPYTGAQNPVLMAWIRLEPSDIDLTEQLLILADGLAPSYAAVMTDLRAIPTVRMSVDFAATSMSAPEWVLVRAETTTIDRSGWHTEHLDLWDESGIHLASGTQLRLVR